MHSNLPLNPLAGVETKLFFGVFSVCLCFIVCVCFLVFWVVHVSWVSGKPRQPSTTKKTSQSTTPSFLWIFLFSWVAWFSWLSWLPRFLWLLWFSRFCVVCTAQIELPKRTITQLSRLMRARRQLPMRAGVALRSGLEPPRGSRQTER